MEAAIGYFDRCEYNEIIDVDALESKGLAAKIRLCKQNRKFDSLG